MRLIAFIAALLVATLAIPQGSRAETIVIGGTGAALGTVEQLGAALAASHPDLTIQVPPSLGSGGGIKALRHGAVDLAVTARPLKTKEAFDGAEVLPFAKTAVAFAVHRDVRRRAVTTAQLSSLFDGSVRTWPNGPPVRPIVRPKVESDTKIVIAQLPAMRTALEAALQIPGLPVALSDQQMADAIEQTPGAIGFTALSVLQSENRAVHILRLNGLMPSPQSIRRGDYPLSKTLYFIVPPNAKAGVRQFLDFVATPRGQAIIEGAGSTGLNFRASGAPAG